MKIIYPKLVEDAFVIASQRGQIAAEKVNDVKSQIYQIMVEKGVLNELGEPTRLALKMGIIERSAPVSSEPSLAVSLADFKRQWPVYAEFKDSHFMLIDGEWMADTYVVKELATRRLADPKSTPEQRLEAQSMLQKIENSQD
ncbi:hypothetical protein A6F53_00145 [Levilactobacillus brevis]|uniref:hypothetical protein n=1 Tax=Levilactobacillus brevis TaxID=1580 RepID=UPI00041D0803|nr:hypothetical protein [Levilactobacillus brevis]ANN47753.1 hypothetical protein A6F53_00145 [Levilactobacillus brevis]ATU70646.1 hypothetical protein CT113_10050 [Levilactobacillus brevis]